MEKVRRMKIDELRPADYNPRVDIRNLPAYEKLKKSIEEFGYVDMIIWNERTGNVVGGHQRLTILKELGYEEIDVTVVDLDETKEKALNLALNKIEGEWDNDLLIELLEELDTGVIDIELTGFDFDEIENLITSYFIENDKEEDGKIDEETFDLEEEAEKIEEPVTKWGDIWHLGKHKLICGDSQEREDVERLMDGQKAQICFTSPPYAEQREYDTESNYKKTKGEDYIEWFEPIAENIKRVLKDNGSFFLNIKEHAENGERSLYVMELCLKLRNELGFKYIDELIWRKRGLPGAYQQRLRNDFEPIHFFAKDPHGVEVFLYEWEMDEDEMKLKSMMNDGYEQIYHFGKTTKFKFFPKRKGSKSKDVPQYDRTNLNYGKSGNVGFKGKMRQGIALPGNVIDINKNMDSIDHPAMYSVQLVEWFLQVFTSRKDVIFEPFAGGGTNFIACEKRDRVCYGVEISPKYCDVIVKRYRDFKESNEDIYLERNGEKIPLEDVMKEHGE